MALNDNMPSIIDPDSSIEIVLNVKYSYREPQEQAASFHRSVFGNLHSTQIHEFKKFDIPIVFLSVADVSQIQTWWFQQTTIRFTSNKNDTPVLSGTNVKILETNLNVFKLPYDRIYKQGNLILEAIL